PELRRVPEVVLVGESDTPPAGALEDPREVGRRSDPLAVYLESHVERGVPGELLHDGNRPVRRSVVLDEEFVGEAFLSGERLQEGSDPTAAVPGAQRHGQVDR